MMSTFDLLSRITTERAAAGLTLTVRSDDSIYVNNTSLRVVEMGAEDSERRSVKIVAEKGFGAYKHIISWGAVPSILDGSMYFIVMERDALFSLYVISNGFSRDSWDIQEVDIDSLTLLQCVDLLKFMSGIEY